MFSETGKIKRKLLLTAYIN